MKKMLVAVCIFISWSPTNTAIPIYTEIDCKSSNPFKSGLLRFKEGYILPYAPKSDNPFSYYPQNKNRQFYSNPEDIPGTYQEKQFLQTWQEKGFDEAVKSVAGQNPIERRLFMRRWCTKQECLDDVIKWKGSGYYDGDKLQEIRAYQYTFHTRMLQKKLLNIARGSSDTFDLINFHLWNLTRPHVIEGRERRDTAVPLFSLCMSAAMGDQMETTKRNHAQDKLLFEKFKKHFHQQGNTSGVDPNQELFEFLTERDSSPAALAVRDFAVALSGVEKLTPVRRQEGWACSSLWRLFLTRDKPEKILSLHREDYFKSLFAKAANEDRVLLECIKPAECEMIEHFVLE